MLQDCEEGWGKTFWVWLQLSVNIDVLVHPSIYPFNVCPLCFLQGAGAQQHRSESSGDWQDLHTEVRLAPEGGRATRGDALRKMCQSGPDAVPAYKSLPGSLLRSAASYSFSNSRSPSSSSSSSAMAASPAPGRAADRKVACCEKCSATLVALKKQALSLAVHHHFSCKVSGA